MWKIGHRTVPCFLIQTKGIDCYQKEEKLYKKLIEEKDLFFQRVTQQRLESLKTGEDRSD